MAWNGSDQKGKVERGGRGREGSGKYHHSSLNTQRSTLRHGLLAGAIVVALGCAAVWWFVGRGGDNQLPTTNKPTTNRTIAEVEPDIATNRPAEVAEKVREKPKEIPFWERPTPEGLTEMEALKWKHHHTVVSTTNDVMRYREKPRYKVFDNDFDNRLGCYLTMEAGRGMVGTTVFDDRLREEFEASLRQPIVIDVNDDDYTKELKKLVRDNKVELANRVRAGEDICEIMQEAHDELIRLATLKRDIEGEFAKYARDENNSINDVEDYFKAANMMLESKGIAPLKASPLLKEAIRLAAVEAGKKPPDDVDDENDE